MPFLFLCWVGCTGSGVHFPRLARQRQDGVNSSYIIDIERGRDLDLETAIISQKNNLALFNITSPLNPKLILS